MRVELYTIHVADGTTVDGWVLPDLTQALAAAHLVARVAPQLAISVRACCSDGLTTEAQVILRIEAGRWRVIAPAAGQEAA